MDLQEIIQELDDRVQEMAATARLAEPRKFFVRANEKWSIAENLHHLVLAGKPLLMAYALPKFVLRLYFGKPNRPSRSYEELVQKYRRKLDEGGKAGTPFIPKVLKTGASEQDSIKAFEAVYHSLDAKVLKWKDADLDNYIFPHPLMGKITAREMLYFTIYHVEHHNRLVKINYF